MTWLPPSFLTGHLNFDRLSLHFSAFNKIKRQDFRRETYLGLIGVPSPESKRRWQQNLSHFAQKSQKKYAGKCGRYELTASHPFKHRIILCDPDTALSCKTPPDILLPHPITAQTTGSPLHSDSCVDTVSFTLR